MEDLLPRYIAGTLSPQEALQVETWMAEDNERRRLVEQMSLIALAADVRRYSPQIDREKALKRVVQRIDKSPRHTWLTWMQRVAAILFIPLLIGALVLHHTQQSHEPMAGTITVSTNPGMTSQLVLPDGTAVHLNTASTLRYPSVFSGSERRVELVGEAFFEVTKDKAHPFIVSTPHRSSIEVYGTSFNVEAYADQNEVTVMLLSGQVAFAYEDARCVKQKQLLQPSQKLVFNIQEAQCRLFTTSGQTETAWKDGKIILDNTPLPQVLRILEKRFHVSFRVKNTSLNGDAFTGAFSTQSLEQIMNVLKLSSHLQWRYASTATSHEPPLIEIY